MHHGPRYLALAVSQWHFLNSTPDAPVIWDAPQCESFLSTRSIAECSAVPTPTVQRSLCSCHAKFSSRRAWRNFFGSIPACFAMSTAVVVAITHSWKNQTEITTIHGLDWRRQGEHCTLPRWTKAASA